MRSTYYFYSLYSFLVRDWFIVTHRERLAIVPDCKREFSALWSVFNMRIVRSWAFIEEGWMATCLYFIYMNCVMTSLPCHLRNGRKRKNVSLEEGIRMRIIKVSASAYNSSQKGINQFGNGVYFSGNPVVCSVFVVYWAMATVAGLTRCHQIGLTENTRDVSAS